MFRRIGWQVVLVGIGFLVAALILLYMAATYTTEFQPAPGGTYVESVGGYPQSLNPLLSFYNDADRDVVALVFSGLTRLNQQGEVEPELAVGWDVDPSGITYTFRLNRNILWHDGFRFTADDVMFTVDLLQDPDYPGPSDLGELWRTVEATKLDEATVQFVLQEPYVPFLDYTTVGILPEHKLSGVQSSMLPALDFNRQPVGTGPFRVEEVSFEQDHIDSVTLKRYPRYHGDSPYLETLIFEFYPTPRAAFEAYEDGGVEGVSQITLELLPEAFSASDLRLYSAPSAEMSMLYLNGLITETLPFNDRRVRQALYFSLDRQALVDEVLMGQAVLPQTPLLPGTWAYTTDDVPTYGYDPSRALDLLADAGWQRSATNGTLQNNTGRLLAFSLIASSERHDLAMAEAIAAQWGRLGISVTVEAVPPLALSGVLDSRSYQSALARLVIPGDPDPYPFWHETQALPGQGQNYAGFDHRRISEILEEARRTPDRNRRTELYAEFQRLFMEEVPALPLYVPIYTYGIDQRVNGGQIGSLMTPQDRFLSLPDWYVLQRRVVASDEDPSLN
jgi:peptide/nickel transport system substrate-binding protein